MRHTDRIHLGILAPAIVLLASCATSTDYQASRNNGISVQVKVYDTRGIENDIKALSDKLGQISVIDQASLIAHFGAIQGAESSQFAMNLQATGLATPSVSTTTNSGTPSIAQTTGTNISSGTPSTQTTLGGNTNFSTPQVQQTVNSGTLASGTTPATPPSSQTVTTTVSNTAGTTSQIVTTIPSVTTTNNNQTVTTTPSNTVQTVTTTPNATPTIPALPTIPSLASPPAPSPSTLDVLGEQMQASYQIIGLRAMMRGAQSDDYTPGGLGKRHVTYGFPITISTPPKYKHAAAEVEISICNPATVLENVPPTVGLMLPQEKTYNVASMVSSSAGLGAGAIIGGIVNVGANFSWTRQTFYIVKQQDTVSLHLDASSDGPSASLCNNPAMFAWQFRPVLGQATVDQGPRMTYALIAFPPTAVTHPADLDTIVGVRRCWRKYNQKTGIVGRRIAGSCVPSIKAPPEKLLVTSGFDTLALTDVKANDNGNGTITTTVYGHFPAGTRVGLGEAYLDDSIPGFENNGTYLRFTTTTQLLAVRGARLLSPDGEIQDVQLTGELTEPINYQKPNYIATGHFQGRPVLAVGGQILAWKMNKERTQLTFTEPDEDQANWRPKLTLTRIVNPGSPPESCVVPYAHSAPRTATIRAYSDTQLEISVPIWQCLDVGSTLAPPPIYVVIIGGKAFGLSDAPFRSFSPDRLTFLVPNGFVQGLTTLKLKRLFFDDQYESTYTLKPSSVAVSGISLLRTTKGTATFALTGSSLDHAAFIYPWRYRRVECCDTYTFVTLTADELASVKALMLKPYNGNAPISITIPSAKLIDNESDSSTIEYSIAIFQKADDHTTYLLTAIPQALNLKGAVVVDPKPISTSVPDDRHLVFDLGKSQVASYKKVFVRLRNGKGGELLTLTLPTPPSSESGSPSRTLSLTKDSKGLAKGATGTYTIKGSNLQLITSVRYLGAPLAFHLASDLSSLTIDQLPANFSANTGQVPLEIRLNDGTAQVYEVPVK